MRHSIRRVLAGTTLATLGALAALPAAATVNITINNTDPPGVGFNDTTPAMPVGGNAGVTVGEQRLIAFQFAADLWGGILNSAVDIVIRASFAPLSCDAQSGVLGSAGAVSIEAGFPNAPLADTWYHSALANSLAGIDLNPAEDDVTAQFNGGIDNNDNCLAGSNWYYGLDNSPGGTDIDFLNVVMHEIAHGLGFSSFMNTSFGNFPDGTPDVYARNALDLTTQLHYDEMTNAQRRDSLINSGNVVWSGPLVTSVAEDFLGPLPIGDVTTPALGEIEVQTASFGPAIPDEGLSGTVVLVDDGSGTVTDGCEPLTAQSAAAVNGNIALIDRGNCAFSQKVGNAEAAGAIAAIVANNVSGGPAPMGGTDNSIGIASVGISLVDGDALKAGLPNVEITLGFDPGRLAGGNMGFVRLYAPNPVEGGSSFSHWDTVASPNLLMEPSITSTLKASIDVDLTAVQFADIGWTIEDADADLVTDVNDNCTEVANPDQRDTNGDGYGNVCDGDLNNDGAINFEDLGLMKSVFFSTGDVDADLDGDGAVNFIDLGLIKASFFGPPGPSGIAPQP